MLRNLLKFAPVLASLALAGTAAAATVDVDQQITVTVDQAAAQPLGKIHVYQQAQKPKSAAQASFASNGTTLRASSVQWPALMKELCRENGYSLELRGNLNVGNQVSISLNGASFSEAVHALARAAGVSISVYPGEKAVAVYPQVLP